MTKMIRIDIEKPDERGLNTTMEVLKQDGIIIFPTDSVYTMGCDIRSKKAYEKLCRLKDVKPEKAQFSIICADFSHLSEFAKQLISLSWGGAGEIPYRYEQGKKQIQDIFGLEVVETKNALKPAKWIYDNPQERANDLMEAFSDKSIKAIISNIGGEDSIRILRHIDIDVIKKNPKIFIGFSDSTITHFLCLKAGLTSFYGTSTLVGFAENGGMHN